MFFKKFKHYVLIQIENNEKEKEELNLRLKNEIESKEVLTTENNKLKNEIISKDEKIKLIKKKYEDLVKQMSTEKN